mmetsp:Transcript_6257/g.15203  ORF Transcript_6257/g.15203 Transcript_6257/m.15203 type:complete len:332 (-) Transcript_6257:2124-3119(-)
MQMLFLAPIRLGSGNSLGLSAKICPMKNFLRSRLPPRCAHLRHYHASATAIAERHDVTNFDGFYVQAVPILKDNYSYLIVDTATKKAAVVDPAEPSKLIKAAKDDGIEITTILTTHHHWDHAGGNAEMSGKISDLDIVVSSAEDYDIKTHLINSGEKHLIKGTTLKVEALPAACHTRGHVMYLLETSTEGSEKSPGALFSGDAIFVGGCGRFFEGNATDMARIVENTTKRVPAATRMFCGHEYTVGNLRFAAAVEPGNLRVQEKLAWAEEQVAGGRFTVPGVFGEEFEYNPFFRCGEPGLAKMAGQAAGDGPVDAVKVMAELRRMKNDFRG